MYVKVIMQKKFLLLLTCISGISFSVAVGMENLDNPNKYSLLFTDPFGTNESFTKNVATQTQKKKKISHWQTPSNYTIRDDITEYIDKKTGHYKCDIGGCGRTFKSFHELLSHLKNKHKIKSKKNKEKRKVIMLQLTYDQLKLIIELIVHRKNQQEFEYFAKINRTNKRIMQMLLDEIFTCLIKEERHELCALLFSIVLESSL
jgi:hypothetical protein